MKTFLTAAALLLCFTSGAQKIKPEAVPAAVKQAFEKTNPGVTAKWEKENGNYEAEFETKQLFDDHGKISKRMAEKSLVYNPAGQLLQTEEEIPVSELPEPIRQYVAKNLAGKQISEASKITLADGGTQYEAEIEKKDYIFHPDGKLLKEENDKEHDDK
jgi:hypothetical protein